MAAQKDDLKTMDMVDPTAKSVTFSQQDLKVLRHALSGMYQVLKRARAKEMEGGPMYEARSAELQTVEMLLRRFD